MDNDNKRKRVSFCDAQNDIRKLQKHNDFTVRWQSDEDYTDRVFMQATILRILQKNAKNYSKKLPFMAKKLEEHLYISAMSKEEYLNEQSLRNRLQTSAYILGTQKTNSFPPQGNIEQEDSNTEERSVTNNNDSILQNPSLGKAVFRTFKSTADKDEMRANESNNSHDSDYLDDTDVNGMAHILVDNVIERHKKLVASPSGCSLVKLFKKRADLIRLAIRFFKCQARFRRLGIKTNASLHYHYIKPQSEECVQQDRQIPRSEQNKNRQSKLAFGANNPYAFHSPDASIGILVAVLCGNKSSRMAKVTKSLNHNTIVVNRKLNQSSITPEKQLSYYDEMLLKSSSQCFPLIKFESSLISTERDECFGNNIIWMYHKEMQNVLDDFFNEEIETKIEKVIPSRMDSIHSVQPYSANEEEVLPTETVSYNAPERINQKINMWNVFDLVTSDMIGMKSICAICDLRMGGDEDEVRLAMRDSKCGQCFHLSCLDKHLKKNKLCPHCDRLLDKPQGYSPSGTLLITRISKPCQGFEFCSRSIVLTYVMASGVQEEYHPNPGGAFLASTKIAYLPDIPEARHLLQRLKYAFKSGLTFELGTPAKFGDPSTIVWSSIPHKTRRTGGSYSGFPDEHYFQNCHNELNLMGIPQSSGCI